jgi:hypothetical protein
MSKKKLFSQIARLISINSYPSAVRVNRIVVDKEDLINDLVACLKKETLFNEKEFRDICYEK